ncbi:NEK1 [Symbiodinium sp. CCMP2456]|nr:NEK1 [Symbiodinium sp. CCMP2456]
MGHSDIRCSYKRIQVVGQGAFGCCWLVQGGRGEQYILRQIDVSKMSEKLKQEAANEVRVLSRLRHPFIINYRECFVEDGLLCVVTDFAESGDLFRSIEKQRAKQDLFSEELVLRWFTQIALALKHIHDRHILHRDLKTQNIFLAGPGEGIVKVGDFGIARVLQHTQDLAKTAIGTPFYLSPEICQEKPYSYQSDIWSLGCILYELATLRHAFDADSMRGLVFKILRGIPSEVASTFSVEFRHMIPKMLQKDPHHRPSVDAILKMTLVRRTIRHLLADLESQQGLPAALPHAKVFSEARRRHPLPSSETNVRHDSPKTRAAASASPSGRQQLHDAAHDGKNSAGRAPSCPSRTDHKMCDSFDTVQQHMSLQGKMYREGRETGHPSTVTAAVEEQLVHVSKDDSLAYRIEALRCFLEKEMGLAGFSAARKQMSEGSTGGDGIDGVIATPMTEANPLQSDCSDPALPTQAEKYLPLVKKLVLFEQECYGLGGRRSAASRRCW